MCQGMGLGWCRLMNEWQPIETAPRDGTTIFLWAKDAGGPFPMAWEASGFNPLFSKSMGIWVLLGGGLTWTEDDPAGAPTHWRPYFNTPQEADK